MELDARTLKAETRVTADVCIIGAGPAGLTLARELADSGILIVLLESGGTGADTDAQSLNDGKTVGSPYHGLRATRHRQVGGSTNLWNTSIDGVGGAKYTPLDDIDLEERAGIPQSGWLFDRGHLEPFYQRAQTVCGLGTFDYDAAHWATPKRPCLAIPNTDHLMSRVYHAGPAHRFTATHANAIRASENVRLVHHATCCSLLLDGARVTGAAAMSSTHGRCRIEARFIVLAAGAIENARLLLVSGEREAAPGNRHGWVGRCFMEHPRDSSIRLIPHQPSDAFERIGFYDLHRSRDDMWIIGRLAVGESALRTNGYPNASVTLLPRRRRRWLEAARNVLSPGRGTSSSTPTTLGYGWSRTPNDWDRCDSVQVLLNLEQHPHPDNRVVLASDRDAYGVPRAELRWRWRDEEQSTLARLRAFLADRLGTLGLGAVEMTQEMRPDPNAHHHAGTTRMSTDARRGVVDADCRVHGTDNLYAAGGSVFPTAGFANPTLTIVALAARLADHLRTRL